MTEATAAEPNEGAVPSPRRPRRTHLINLCCAQSVQGVVEEVARSLRGLGFRVRVVCGAEARAALLGSRANSDTPMIHVVCVQGSLQERVLKPLRQALATHGGPNHHLFVAVLDLAVPLAMVGQIRRFAEALERPDDPRQPGPKGRKERRRWREHSPHRNSERIPTHSYPSVTQVVERPGAAPARSSEDGADRPRRRTKSLTARGRAVRIGPTSKYRAVTASHQAVPPPASNVRKRRRERSAARPADTKGRGERVLGLPTSSEASGPPPPPAPGEMARRRSSTTLPALEDEPKPSTTKTEPDRLQPRPGPSLRFTPPAVKAAEVARTNSGRIVAVPPGAADSVSETASTLRLEEPPFPAPEDRTMRYGMDELREQVDAQAAKAKGSRSLPSTGDTGTMIGSDRSDSSSSTSGSLAASLDDLDGAPPREDKTVLYRAGASEDESSAEEPSASDSAATLLRPSLPGRDDEDGVAESDKSMLGPDGAFVTTRTLMERVERSAAAKSAEPPPPADEDLKTISEATRPPILLDPEDREGDDIAEAPKKKTILYAENERPPKPDELGDAGKKKTVLYAEDKRPPKPGEPGSPMNQAGHGTGHVKGSRGIDAAAEADAEDEPATSPRLAKPDPGVDDDEPSTTPRLAKPRRTKAAFAAETIPEPPAKSRTWLWAVLGLLVIGGGFGAYQAGLFETGGSGSSTTVATMDGKTPPDPTPSAADDGSKADDGAGADDDAAPAADGATPAVGDSEAADAGSTGDAAQPADATGGAQPEPDPDPIEPEPEPEPVEPEPAPDPIEPEPTGDGPRLAPEEEVLAKAVDERRIVMLKTLFVSRRQGEATSWSGGMQRCGAFEVDGVGGWRLPHRREMKAINVSLPLPRGIYWTYTVPKDDRKAAYVLDTDTNGLSLFLKQEPTGEVLCVRRRKYPDK